MNESILAGMYREHEHAAKTVAAGRCTAVASADSRPAQKQPAHVRPG